MRGFIRYSIKYDLGGSIKDFEKARKAIEVRFTTQYTQSDLRVFNFSFLSRAYPSYLLPVQSFSFGHHEWKIQPTIEGNGILTLELMTHSVEAYDEKSLTAELLALHDLFIADKNIDYINYLNKHNQLTGRLAETLPSNEKGVLQLGQIVDEIRNLIKPFISSRTMYVFHDFRPIFCIEDLAQLDENSIRSLTNLAEFNAQAASGEFMGNASGFGRVGRIWGNSWSFVVDVKDWTEEVSALFSHSHSNWFLAQAAIFEMRDLDEKIIGYYREKKALHKGFAKSFVDTLKTKKNEVFLDLFSVLNSDFITKNSTCRDEFSFLKMQFGMNSQIEILEKYIDRISHFLSDYHNAIDQENTRNVVRNTRTLEFLFVINTIAGIGAFAPTFFSNDVNEKLVLDLPRLISLSMISFSVIFYLLVVVLGGFMRIRQK